MYPYIKALHIIFVVTWFAGIFYMPRFFIYMTEAGSEDPNVSRIIRNQLQIMMRRLWMIITWPSAIITLVLGLTLAIHGGWLKQLGEPGGRWLLVKLVFVVLLYGYHFSMHRIFKELEAGVYRFTSQQLRMYNEVSTLLLFAIVMLATVKTMISFVYGLVGIVVLGVVLMVAVKIYKRYRGEGRKV
ncbi:CopD family protein [Flavihumibacter petaseus]|uniref:Protoporphyrinogen IX oxidase n=1 Tax=Flavihumibacter petaseus NBRC 106054 TaxID=1220578 RepID=A0A0E9MVJ6_9BACT|nr:CopD family protein [Flavihumibacter petaseus]GAO41782.1 hypothetical protein FPE01S_01_07960 [Flavihumibacter petaseus NBRC 106054]